MKVIEFMAAVQVKPNYSRRWHITGRWVSWFQDPGDEPKNWSWTGRDNEVIEWLKINTEAKDLNVVELEVGERFSCDGCQDSVSYPHRCGGL